jgi:MFS family permease
MHGARNLSAIILALALMQVAGGTLAIVVPLALDARASGAIAIGVVTACYGLGLMAGALAAPRFIAAIGNIRAFAFFAALAAALTLALYIRIAAFPWSLLRIAIGVCAAGIFTAGESWVATEAPKQRRGALMGFYYVISKFAAIAGALVVAELEPDEPAAYMIAGAIFALSLAPVAATRKAPPPPPSTEPFSPGGLVRKAPAAFVAAAAAGLINSAVTGLSPVYAAASDPAHPGRAAALFYAALMLGGVASQFPAGSLSDRVDRRLVIGALAAAAAAACFALAILPPWAPQTLQLLFAFALGAGSMSYYGVAVAHAVDRAAAPMHARVIAGLLVVWAAGNVVGPLIAGVVMQAVGSGGLFVYAGVASLLLAVAMARRSSKREPVAAEDREPFATAPATSLAAAGIDPRVVAPLKTSGGEAGAPDDP